MEAFAALLLTEPREMLSRFRIPALSCRRLPQRKGSLSGAKEKSMNLYHLRYFVTLAHLEHYTKAAEVLGITQPSLSHAIASLEEELKVRLFEKDGRNIVLTKWGNIFLQDVEDILNRLDSSVENLQMTGSGNGTVDIACIRLLGNSYVPRLMRSFLEDHPGKDIRFKLHSEAGLSSGILAGLKNREYDIAFCSRHREDPLIDYVPIGSQTMVLAVPPDHPLASKEAVSLKETLPYPQIMFERHSGLRYEIDHLFEQIRATPACIMEVDEDQVIAGLVGQGFGIAVLPLIPFLKTCPVRLLRITDPRPECDLYMACLKGAYVAPLVTSFKEYVQDYQYRSDSYL